MTPDRISPSSLRLDKWLFHARFVKQRTKACDLLRARRVRVNDQLMSKPHYQVRPGDVITLVQPERVHVVEVVDLGARRGPSTEAQALYRLIESF